MQRPLNRHANSKSKFPPHYFRRFPSLKAIVLHEKKKDWIRNLLQIIRFFDLRQTRIEKVLCAFVRYFFCVKKWDMIDGKHHGRKTVRPYLRKKVRTDV